MSFKLSNRSLGRLEGINPKLQVVTKRAIELTKVDFGVTCGLRTLAEQKALKAAGATQTLKSKHLDGNAVDVVAYIGSRISWELNLYDDIAEAFKMAAKENHVKLRWGGAWSVPDIRVWNKSMEAAMNSYIDLRRSEGRKPFIDGPHFELN